jgi:hypothetical protein
MYCPRCRSSTSLIDGCEEQILVQPAALPGDGWSPSRAAHPAERQRRGASGARTRLIAAAAEVRDADGGVFQLLLEHGTVAKVLEAPAFEDDE